jgi:hypothetical protein
MIKLQPNAKNLRGDKINRLLVLEVAATAPMRWHCKCDCGNACIRSTDYLTSKERFKSCGCRRSEVSKRAHWKHGKGGTNIYRAWHQMMARCYKPNTHNYPRYGGRGITVCERWKDFSNFIADMGERPPRHSLERIDNNGPYSPENCRWATPMEQSSNMRINRRITAFGQTFHVAEWARRLSIPEGRIRSRLAKGISGEDALK